MQQDHPVAVMIISRLESKPLPSVAAHAKTLKLRRDSISWRILRAIACSTLAQQLQVKPW